MFSKVTMSYTSLLITLLTSCGAPQHKEPNPSTNKNTGDNSATVNDAVVPPQEYYDALLTDRMQALDQGSLNLRNQQILWLNFNGATVNKGYNKDQSFIICSRSTTIPSSGYSTDDQAKIVKQVAQYFSNAGVDIAITYTKPTAGDFTTMIVGGKYADLGCGSSSSTLGIAPYDVDNANPNDIGFAFVPSNKDLITQAITIAHESAHTFGLDHTDNRVDIMYPSVSSQETGFATGNAGRKIQNGPLMLQKNLGSGFASVSGTPVQPNGTVPTPDPNATPSNPIFPNTPDNNPNIADLPGIPGLGGLSQIISQLNPSMISQLAPLLPSLGNLPGGTTLNNPQTILAALTLFQNGAVKQNGGTYSLNSVMNNLTGSQAVSFGGSVLGILGLATGNPAGIATNALAPIVIDGLSSSTSSPSSAQPCDVAGLLGMSNVSNQGSLIALIPQYAQAINANASGTQAQALTDAVKIAVGQTYISIGNAKNP